MGIIDRKIEARMQDIKNHLSGNTSDRDTWGDEKGLLIKGTDLEKYYDDLDVMEVLDINRETADIDLEVTLRKIFRNAMQMAINVIESFE